MAVDNDAKRLARNKFVFERQPQTKIADSLGVSSATIRRWKAGAKRNGDDWDLARAAHVVAGEGLDSFIATMIEDFVIMSQNMTAELKQPDLPLEQRVQLITSLADAMTKVTSAAGKLAPKISELGVAQDVIARLVTYVQEYHPNAAPQLLEVLEPFSETIVQAYKS